LETHKEVCQVDSKTGNEIAGKDRGYTHQEIQKILGFADQRLKTIFLILASTGMRIGGLQLLKVGDLQKIQDLYKITVYSGDKEQYYTFCTPECTKEIDAYLDFRERRGESINNDSNLIVTRFSLKSNGGRSTKGHQFEYHSLRSLLQTCINNSGLREVDHNNRHKRKEIPLLHGFIKFWTKQLIDSDVKAEIREILRSMILV
jgi:integrase